MLDKRLGVLVKSLGEQNFSLEDLLIDGHWVLVIEGVNSGDHLIEKDSEGPPVDSLSVTLVKQDLRGEVLWGSAESVGSSFDYFCKSEISKLEVAIWGDEKVLRLEVSVNCILGVEVLEHHGNLGGVETNR